MIFSELLQYLFQAQSLISPSIPPQYLGCGPEVYCPGSAFTAIGAAFATQGYWIHADLLYYLTYTKFGLWAPLLYILAAAGGLVGVAIGMPPRTYMWFFLGPAIYSWLLGTTVSVHGVEWQVAGVPQDQRQVWKLAEIGLVNSNIAKRMGEEGGIQFSKTEAPTRSVEVAHLFVWYDEVISSTVQWLIRWTGVYSQRGNPGVSKGDTSLHISVDGAGNRFDAGEWHLLSDMKWQYLNTITSAALTSPQLRDSFFYFLRGGCGKALMNVVNPEAVAAAKNSNTTQVPASLFFGTYDDVDRVLTNEETEIPVMLKRFMMRHDFEYPGASEIGGFRSFAPGLTMEFDQWIAPAPVKKMTCHDYLTILIEGFRWEAGGIYHQLTSPAFDGVSRDQVIYNLFYGWDVPVDNVEQLSNFVKDLILVHLFKNEIQTHPVFEANFDQVRENSTDKSIEYALAQQRIIGQKAKFAEVYVWAQMVPKVQAFLLYVLAIAYPVACVLVVIPGWHKIILTWMSFWAWAKLWDVGFAICMVIERSLWATLGNNSHFAMNSGRVVEMQNWGTIRTLCPDGNMTCNIPMVMDTISPFTPFKQLLMIFDRALVLSANLDLDLSNSYYIYLMSGLYFSVPAVTGQLVLGAKSGASGMINSLIGGVAGESARGTSSGIGDALSNRFSSAANAGDLASNVAALKDKSGKLGLAGRAFDQQNQGATQDMMSNVGGVMTGATSAKERNNGIGFQAWQYAMNPLMKTMEGATRVGNSALENKARDRESGRGGAPGITSGRTGPTAGPGFGRRLLPGGGAGAAIAAAGLAGTMLSMQSAAAEAPQKDGDDKGGDHSKIAAAGMGLAMAGIAAPQLRPIGQLDPLSNPLGLPQAPDASGGAGGANAGGGGGGGGPGGRAPGGGPMQIGPGANSARALRNFQMALQGASATAEVGYGIAQHRLFAQTVAAQAGYAALQGDWSVAGAVAGMQARGYNVQSGRDEGFAGYKANNEARMDHNQVAGRTSGMAGALGVLSGAQAARNYDQTMIGLGRDAQLGSNTQAASNFFGQGNPAGYFGILTQGVSPFLSDYAGGKAIAGSFNNWGSGEALGFAASAVATGGASLRQTIPNNAGQTGAQILKDLGDGKGGMSSPLPSYNMQPPILKEETPASLSTTVGKIQNQ